MNIVLIARQNYAGCITEGEEYTPLCQTKTGFLIKGDDDVEIDLYIHFFRIGCKNGDTKFILPERIQKEKTLSEGLVSETKKQEPKTEPKSEAPVKKVQKETIVEPKEETSSISHLIDEDDDF